MTVHQRTKSFLAPLFGSLFLLMGIGAPAWAIPFSAVDTQGTVGTAGGASQAMVVIDWDTDSFAWLFEWNGPATYADAYDAILAAEGGNFSWSQAAFVLDMSYTTGGQTYSTGSPGWLSFWSSTDGSSWSTTNLGVYDEPMVNGGWAGAQANLPEIWPGSAPTVPIPEPGTALLMTLGLAMLSIKRNARA